MQIGHERIAVLGRPGLAWRRLRELLDRAPCGALGNVGRNKEDVVGFERDIFVASFEDSLYVHGNFGAFRSRSRLAFADKTADKYLLVGGPGFASFLFRRFFPRGVVALGLRVNVDGRPVLGSRRLGQRSRARS